MKIINIINKIFMLLILFFCIFIFEVQSLATNSIIIEDTKKEIKEDIIKISAE